MSKLKARLNAVIVKPLTKEEKMYGGLIVPDVGKEKNEIGEIVSIGEGKYSVMGSLIPPTYKVGEIVILPTMGFTKFQHDDIEYYVGREEELLGVIED